MSDFITEADLARRLGVEVERVTEWRRMYAWPHLKIGRQVRYTEADVRAIEAMHHVEPSKVAALPGQTKRSAARSA